MLYTLRFFFSSKCSLFHNANLFGSCIIHILYTGVLKLKNNNSGAKGLNGTASHPDMQKIRITEFFYDNRLYCQFEFPLLLFTVCFCVWTFRPSLIWSSRGHNTVLYLIRCPLISRQVGFGYPKGQADPNGQRLEKWSSTVPDSTSHTIVNFNTSTLSCLSTRKIVTTVHTEILLQWSNREEWGGHGV